MCDNQALPATYVGPRLDTEKISNWWIVPLSSYLTNIVQSGTN
jgi:hypothetical protein